MRIKCNYMKIDFVGRESVAKVSKAPHLSFIQNAISKIPGPPGPPPLFPLPLLQRFETQTLK